MKNYCVITTINNPTKAIEELYKHFGINLLIVGDEKTPQDWNYYGVKPFIFSDKSYAPKNHYARKNLGYMLAIENGAKLIFDTDDDNIPNDNWGIRDIKTNARESISEGWHNVYGAFAGTLIWPRGFSLKEARNYEGVLGDTAYRNSSIQQGLSDGEPDVDAIWRIARWRPMKFENNVSIYLKTNTWCPFNSQVTWWFPKAYPLMYLPVTASFRMTDIWRSFVAQRCLWEIGEGVTFHSPAEVFQDRNEHDLMKDFEDEIPGYLLNDKIVEILGGITLKCGDEFVCENLLTCYQALVENDILPKKEIDSVKEWIKDIKEVWEP